MSFSFRFEAMAHICKFSEHRKNRNGHMGFKHARSWFISSCGPRLSLWQGFHILGRPKCRSNNKVFYILYLFLLQKCIVYIRDRRGRDRKIIAFTTTYAISAYHLLTLWVWIPLRRGALDVTFCDKVRQWLATGRWFSTGIPVSSTNKTDCKDITEILLKVALRTIDHKSTIKQC
jgi:hypothetical protein